MEVLYTVLLQCWKHGPQGRTSPEESVVTVVPHHLFGLDASGSSSSCTFLIHAFGVLFFEFLRMKMKRRGVHQLLRCLVYVIPIYVLKFSIGEALAYFLNLHPWDLSYNFMQNLGLHGGTVVLWFLAGIWYEFIIGVMKKFEELKELLVSHYPRHETDHKTQ